MADINFSPIGSQLQSPVIKTVGPKPEMEAAEAKNGTFGQWLTKSLGEVDRLQDEADSASQKLITGQSQDIHGTMISLQKASIAFELAMEIRNKVVAAYEEIKRMQF
ncbi:MAG: flagellar hook-basal body complex protein FliE [Desulfobacteraceae bacterium]|nr:flagellar hook-basal body complex protein FliE [Desulfobacteraceae bacterium]